jgi:hypothetical protein
MKNKPVSSLGPLLSLLILGSVLLTGCGMTTTTKAMVRSANSANKRLAILQRSDPMTILKGIKDSREESPKVTILESSQKPVFAPIKFSSFLHLHPLDEKEIQQNGFSFRKFKVNLNESTLAEPKQLHKKLFFDSSKPVVTENVILVDDFFPLLPSDSRRLLRNLPQLAYFTSDPSFVKFGRSSQIASLHETGSPLLKRKGYLGYPLGYEDLDTFIPINMDAFVLVYNATSWDIYQQLEDLHKKNIEESAILEGKQAQENALDIQEVFLEELEVADFLNLLKQKNFTLHFPDPLSNNRSVREAGMAFLCQLLYWLMPDDYRSFLKNPKSPKARDVMEQVSRFLQYNHQVLRPESSLDNLLNHVQKHNILKNLPSNFKMEDSIDYQELPFNYHIDELDHRMSFGFIPESFYAARYTELAFKEKNKDVLDAIEARKEEKARVRRERKEKQAKRRKARQRRRRGSRENSEKSEEVEEAETEEAVEEAIVVDADLTRLTQLSSFIVDAAVARRNYLGVPANAMRKKHGLYFINSMLQLDAQKGFSLAPRFLRPIRPELELDLYVKKASLKRKARKATFYTLQVLIAQNQMEPRFLPILNSYYRKALEKGYRGR